MNYEEFKNKIYSNLISYKKEMGIVDFGTANGRKNEAVLPERYWEEELPKMLYDGIRPAVADMQASKYRYKYHLYAKKHVASSQTACVNLFVPILESSKTNVILKTLDVCPKDFKCVARDVLFHGYCFEFWDFEHTDKKGHLEDHSNAAGTDSDVAIAYYNTKDELCLWLIEHKLTEREFTKCGGYSSEGNTEKGRLNCKTHDIAEIIVEPQLCYYWHCCYNYWYVMAEYSDTKLFTWQYDGKGCAFRGGMNQLWRNQLLGVAIEKDGIYKRFQFSVVHHPENHFLDKTMQDYRKMVPDEGRFNSFTSDKLVEAAEKDEELKEWIGWYRKVYYGEK